MKIEPFEKYTGRYEDWFEKHKFAYKSELKAVKAMLPKRGTGIEIGVGTGRFAAPLGIKYGIEPSSKMRAVSKKRGIKVVDGTAEKIPFDDEKFDYALMVVTLCFLDYVGAAFKEIYRILKPNGYFINADIDKGSKLGKLYEKNKQKNVFYRIAKFYSVDNVVERLKKAGFRDFEFNQTIFRNLKDVNSIEPIKKGHGNGLFAVIKARK